MVLRLIAEQEVICTTCRKSVNYENSAIHACEGPAPAVAPQPQQPVVDPEPAQAMRQILEDAQAGKFSPEVEKICTAYVKMRLKESTDGCCSELVERYANFLTPPPPPHSLCNLP